jgi:hypothetical protein
VAFRNIVEAIYNASCHPSASGWTLLDQHTEDKESLMRFIYYGSASCCAVLFFGTYDCSASCTALHVGLRAVLEGFAIKIGRTRFIGLAC